MESRARTIVFWPDMTNGIRAVREHCSASNQSAPSKAATPRSRRQSLQPPFESIFADFFLLWWLSLSCDWRPTIRMAYTSGWVDIFKAPLGTAQAGAQGLIAAMRTLFAAFGVPEEISSDGGPECSSLQQLPTF